MAVAPPQTSFKLVFEVANKKIANDYEDKTTKTEENLTRTMNLIK